MLSTIETCQAQIKAFAAEGRQYEAYLGFAFLLHRLAGHGAYRIQDAVTFYQFRSS